MFLCEEKFKQLGLTDWFIRRGQRLRDKIYYYLPWDSGLWIKIGISRHMLLDLDAPWTMVLGRQAMVSR